MLAVKGLYHNGQVTLKGKFPMKSAEVIVVFPDIEEDVERTELTTEKKRELFEEFSGSVSRVIDIKQKRWRLWIRNMKALIDTNVILDWMNFVR